MLTRKSYFGQINTGNNITTSAWTSRTTNDNFWHDVTWGNGLFVAVAYSGTGNRVMTSPDGVTWTTRTSAADNNWLGVTWGNGLFVAVASSGTGNRVMTSPDGITWTIRTSASDSDWRAVTYGNGLFVAVANFTGVMTSPDGIVWTSRTPANSMQWNGITYGNGLFVAVASAGGVGNRVMTSPNGVTWTSLSAGSTNDWFSVTYGNGLFVTVSYSGTDRVMTSPDGITWTLRSAAVDNNWYGVTYGNGLFVATAASGTGNRVMTSPDGITWTIGTTPADNFWLNVTYGNGVFVAVSQDGTGNRVMTWQGNVGLPLLTYDTSTQLVSSINSLPISPGVTGSIFPNVFYNSSTASLSYGYVNSAGNTGDIFTLAAQEFGSTIKSNNVMVPNISRINAGYTLTGNNTSAMYTTTVYAAVQHTVTGVTFYQQQQGAYTANNYNGVGLYQFQGATGTLLASSATDVSLYKAASGTFVSKAFSTPVTISPSEYVIAFVYSNSATTTLPILGGLASTTNFPNLSSFNMTNGAKMTASKTPHTALSANIQWSDLTVTAPTTPYLWAVLY